MCGPVMTAKCNKMYRCQALVTLAWDVPTWWPRHEYAGSGGEGVCVTPWVRSGASLGKRPGCQITQGVAS